MNKQIFYVKISKIQFTIIEVFQQTTVKLISLTSFSKDTDWILVILKLIQLEISLKTLRK